MRASTKRAKGEVLLIETGLGDGEPAALVAQHLKSVLRGIELIERVRHEDNR